ncbi:MAG: hypothetical protein K2M36_03025, partial [Clostridia bacterium]|nr:hypothetical protein [Clostridia bacterium]
MREIAMNAILRTQSGQNSLYEDFNSKLKGATAVGGFKAASECSADDLVRNNVVSSRIRLARNAAGMDFPHRFKPNDRRADDLLISAAKAAHGLFDALVSKMPD